MSCCASYIKVFPHFEPLCCGGLYILWFLERKMLKECLIHMLCTLLTLSTHLSLQLARLSKETHKKAFTFVNHWRTEQTDTSKECEGQSSGAKTAGETCSYLEYSCLREKLNKQDSDRKWFSLVFRREVDSLLYRRHAADPLHRHSVMLNSISKWLTAQRGREEDAIQAKLFTFCNVDL